MKKSDVIWKEILMGRQKKERLVAVWLPRTLLRALDRAVAARDTDRSKFIRSAIRERLARKLTRPQGRDKTLVRARERVPAGG
jgi:metal-responsive CopG/Arc/MetJ family transcriptional regulator